MKCKLEIPVIEHRGPFGGIRHLTLESTDVESRFSQHYH